MILSGAISQSNIFGSGKYVSLQVGTGKINRAIGIGYTNPYFTVDGVSQGFDVYHKRTDPQDLGYVYATESTGGGVRFGIPISEKQSISFGAGIDYTKVTINYHEKDESGNFVTPLQYRNFSDDFCNSQDSCSNVSLPLTAGWKYDTKDSAINPTRGAYQSLAFEVSPAGDIKYYKATYQHQRFFPVTRNWTLMLNGELGYAKGLGGQAMPFYKNFYAGGPGSVRGYEASSLGPYQLDSDGDVVHLGGTKRVIFNAELSVPVPGFGADKSLKFGPFFDAGQVFGESGGEVKDAGSIRMSAGLAATWISPLGPFKFSLAQPLNDSNDDKLQRFQFQMGQTF